MIGNAYMYPEVLRQIERHDEYERTVYKDEWTRSRVNALVLVEAQFDRDSGLIAW